MSRLKRNLKRIDFSWISRPAAIAGLVAFLLCPCPACTQPAAAPAAAGPSAATAVSPAAGSAPAPNPAAAPAPVQVAAAPAATAVSPARGPVAAPPAAPTAAPAMPPAVSLDAPPGKTLTLNRVVRYEHRLVNASDAPADMEMFLAVPRDNERQRILFFAADPASLAGREKDAYGNVILHYVDRNVPPGGVIFHGWIAEVEISSMVYDGDGAAPGGKEGAGSAFGSGDVPGNVPAPSGRSSPGTPALSPGMRRLFLRDGANYGLSTPAVRNLAARLAAGRRPAEAVRRIFRYLLANVRYERDDVWDAAPKVIERGSGSCSEYNFAFVALCRAACIPARYTGGIVLRAGAGTAYDEKVIEDAVFHRWSEVFLPHQGWTPVDCSRASGEMKRYGNPDNSFARLPAGLLQCVRGDGLAGTPLGWDYLSNQKVPFEARDWSAKVGFWLEGAPPGLLAKRVALLKPAFTGPPAAGRGPVPAAGPSARPSASPPPRQDRAFFDGLLESSLDREILFLFMNFVGRDALPDLVAALAAARLPAAIHWSILAEERGVSIPPDLSYSALCDGSLKERIEKVLVKKDGKRDLFTFEYWWRKARPKTRWDEKAGRFTLTSRKINIY